MKKKDTIHFIRTYDNGVLQFVIGRTYTAMGTCGSGKDQLITGELSYYEPFKHLELLGKRGQRYAINERTLSYL